MYCPLKCRPPPLPYSHVITHTVLQLSYPVSYSASLRNIYRSVPLFSYSKIFNTFESMKRSISLHSFPIPCLPPVATCCSSLFPPRAGIKYKCFNYIWIQSIYFPHPFDAYKPSVLNCTKTVPSMHIQWTPKPIRKSRKTRHPQFKQ